MKTFEALNILTTLSALKASNKALPVKFAYASTINAKRLSDIAEAFEAGRRGLLDKYGKRDAEDKLIETDGHITITDVVGFNAEIQVLQESDHPEITLHQVTVDDMPAELTLSDMASLMPMIKE